MATSPLVPQAGAAPPNTGAPQAPPQDGSILPVVQAPEFPPTPPAYGINNRQLPDQLVKALEQSVKFFQEQDMHDRRVEVLGDRTLRFYDDGVQHIYPAFGNNQYPYVIAGDGGSINIDGEEVELPEFQSSFNIFRARRRTIDAVLTQNPPGIDFTPNHPDRSEDIEAAETAEGYRHLFDQSNDVHEIQQNISRMFELSGRCVTWTHSKQDVKFGYNDQGEIRTMETTDVYGTLESKVSITARCPEYTPFCFLMNDIDNLIARQRNPWLKDDAGSWKFSAGEGALGESDWERFARIGVKQVRKGFYIVGTAIMHLVTEMQVFLRPSAFEDKYYDATYTGPDYVDEEGNDGYFDTGEETREPLTLRDKMLELFPEGVHAVFVGRAFSEAYPECFDDNIDIGFPVERDGLSGGALMEPMKVIQDNFNDLKNSEFENYVKGWPITWFKGDSQDYDAFVNQKSKPHQFALLQNSQLAAGQPLEQLFFQEPGLEVPASFTQCLADYQGNLSQDVTGALAALTGAASPDNTTASGKAIDRNQATGILSPAWANLQRIFAGIYKKAALHASKNPDHAQEIAVVQGGKTITIRLERLNRGTFHCHPDTDSTFPESTSAKRASLAALLPLLTPNNPVAADFFNSPDNWEEILNLQGFPELTLTPAIAYKKQTRELELLLREAPVPNPAFEQYNQQHLVMTLQSGAQGLPMPQYAPPPQYLPSIMPKKYDYHKWELAKCQEYLSSEDAWRQEIEGNTAGIENVTLHAQVHEAMLAQSMMPPPPPFPVPMQAPNPNGAAGQAPEANANVQQKSAPPGAPNKSTQL